MADGDRVRKYNVARYGLTQEDYLWMLDQQDGLCAICREEPTGTQPNTAVLQVDHDHLTSMNRSLLCHNCNLGLGQFGDSIETLMRAVAYLRFYEEMFRGVPAA